MTTITKRLLKIMTDGQPHSMKSLAERSGLSEAKVRETLAHMRQFGHVESSPVIYTITEKGKQRAVFEPKWPVRRREPKEKPADMVSQTIRTQPNSVFAMGAQ